MSVKWEDVKPGDKIKVRYKGLITEDWMTVKKVGTNGSTLYARIDHWTFYSDDAEIFAHQPAPRKVEVTLGTPLDHVERSYRESAEIEVQVALMYDKVSVFLRLGSGTAVLGFAEARRLFLDGLATVGIED